MHFDYLDSSPGYAAGKAREYYTARLTKLLKSLGKTKYDKTDTDMYVLLGPERLQTAINYAHRLQAIHSVSTQFHQCSPATTVYELVELLLSYAPENQ